MMRRSTSHYAARGGFTIVEILVVIAIILVLLSLVVVAVGSATRTAQRTNTSALMNNIKQALVHFQNDVGYLPPVLDVERNLEFELPQSGIQTWNGPDPADEANFQSDIQDWYSITTLAEYLIGYGPENEDGHDGPGIRHPGSDGYWGATNVSLPLASRGRFRGGRAESAIGANDGWLSPTGPYATQSQSYRQGRVYGPYLQLTDDRLLGAINPDAGPDAGGNFQVFFPGEAGYNDSWPKVIVDYWGEPIRYYRRPYPQGGINRGYRQIRGQEFDVPTLADVYVLRPYSISTGAAVDTRFGDNSTVAPDGDRTATYELTRAEFALFSSGPNRRLNQQYRVDSPDFGAGTDEVNRDNIVELGP